MQDLLIFGKTGQVARELAKLMPEARFLDRNEADLSQPEDLSDVIVQFRPGAIINAAAYTAVDKAESEPDLAQKINGIAPARMAEAAGRLGVPFLHISTDYVFDGAGSLPWVVDAPTGPLGVYGASKLAGERGVAQSGAQWAILRTSWVFSSHGNNFVKTMTRLGAERDELSIVADQIGGPTPAADIASALRVMANTMLSDRQAGGIYHFSGAPDVSWAGFAREIFTAADLKCRVKEITTSEYPTPAQRPANSRLDCAALAQDFGIQRPDWRSGLRNVIQEIRQVE